MTETEAAELAERAIYCESPDPLPSRADRPTKEERKVLRLLEKRRKRKRDRTMLDLLPEDIRRPLQNYCRSRRWKALVGRVYASEHGMVRVLDLTPSEHAAIVERLPVDYKYSSSFAESETTFRVDAQWWKEHEYDQHPFRVPKEEREGGYYIFGTIWNPTGNITYELRKMENGVHVFYYAVGDVATFEGSHRSFW